MLYRPLRKVAKIYKRLYGRRKVCAPPPSNLHFQTWQFYLFLGALSSGVYGFFRACPYQKLKKKVEGSIVTSLKTTEWKQIRKHDLYTVDDRLVTYYFPFLSKVFCLICFQHMEGLN